MYPCSFRSLPYHCYRLHLRNTLIIGLTLIAFLVYYFLSAKIIKNEVISRRTGTIKTKHLQVVTVMAQSYNLHDSNQKIFRCLSSELKRPTNIRWNNNQWQNPENTGLFLYSAFYDSRMKGTFSDGHSFVRILAMHDGSDCSTINCHYYCHIWFGNQSNTAIVVGAEIREIWHTEWDSESQHAAYRPHLLSCILPKKYDKVILSKVSAWVSLTNERCKATSTYVFVQNLQPTTNAALKKDLVICVKPIDFVGDFSRKLIEWIEINKQLGIDKIHFYTFRTHPNVEKVLNYYKIRHMINVIPTTLAGEQPNYPVERTAFLKRNLWQKRRNELLPYNDCFYRHLYSHKYVIPIDVDELIVPRKQDDLHQLISFLENSMEFQTIWKTYASFSVRNAYFFESLMSDDTMVKDVEGSYFLRHVVRSANFSDPSKSMKSLVRTDAALTVFNHYVLESLLPGVGRSHEIPIELVQMNHYRSSCPSDMSYECKNNFLKYTKRDNILMKYKSVLLSLNEITGLLDI